LVRQEVESGEDLLLLFKIGIKGLLASLNILVEAIELFFSALSGASVNNTAVFDGIAHQLLPVDVDLLEALGVIGKLATNILGGKENGVESGPVLLHFNPDLNDSVDSLEGLLPLADVLLKFFDFLLGEHVHQVQRLLVNEFNDLFESTEFPGVTTLDKGEVEVVPSAGDDVDLGLNLCFLLGTIDDLSHLFGILVQVKLDQVVHTELGRGVVDLLLSDSHQFLPVARLHEL
jgi:hypothetical protein